MPAKTTCCVVGGGPAGVVLAYLLARDGINVTLLELHKDFDRDFRGDTFHATSMELVEDLGLMDKLDPLIRSRLKQLTFITENGKQTPLADFSRLRSKYPYVAVIPQVEFLDLLVAEAGKFPSFKVLMQANAQEFLEENGRVVGVKYSHAGNMYELRADLVVGADGRGSRLRAKAGFELQNSAPPMDVIWFRFDRRAGEPLIEGVDIQIKHGNMMVQVSRGDSYQFGLIVVKGSSKTVRDAGIEAFQELIKPMMPSFLQGRAKEIGSFSDMATLAVQVGRIKTWHKPGLLLIGDAAHVMSPIGGVGINYAIQDAIAAYQILAGPLKSGNVTDADLAAVQERREKPTIVMQKFQTLAQNHIVKRALDTSRPFEMPLPVRILSKIPGLRNIPAKIFAYGSRPERLKKQD